MVRTLRCGRSNPGSNPGHGIVLLESLLRTLLTRNNQNETDSIITVINANLADI